MYYIKGIKEKLFNFIDNQSTDIYKQVFYLPIVQGEKVFVAKVMLENIGELNGG